MKVPSSPPAPQAGLVGRLAAAGCVAPEEEADELLACATDANDLEDRVCRRERGEPLAWITGTARFGAATVRLAPGVYVPRPQTEELARRAARRLPRGGWAVDLCTGSGALARHLKGAVPSAGVVGVDIDPVAARCALGNDVPCALGDLGAALRAGVFDLVTAVAPYVPSAAMPYLPADVARYEPRRCLDGGDDGLAVVHRVVVDAAHLLRQGGWLLVELGGDQDALVAPALAAAGFGHVTPWSDEDGDLRGLEAQLIG